MILALALLLVISQSHLIIDVSSTNSEVSANNILGIRILTSSAISANTLSLTFPADFTVSQPCFVNGTSVTCSFASTSSSLTVSLASALSTNTYYLLTFNVSNPYYSSNFPISAAVSSVSFSNTALVSISPKTIVCSQNASSPLVADTSAATFIIGNDALPAGSVITINSTLQTTFSNLFAPSPVCSINNVSYSCVLSTSFGQQFLKISGIPQNSNLRIAVSFMNNAPYNASMGSVNIQIQNSAGYFMQVCSFQQPAPTVLRTSSFLAVAGWNQQVGSTSTATFTLSPNMAPYSNTLLWVLPTSISVTPLSPTSTSITMLNGKQRLLISGASILGNSLTFTAQITNPTAIQNITSDIYIVYSSTLFIEQLTVTTMSLSPLTLSPSISLSNYLTQTNSTYNISIPIPYTIYSGISSVITLDLGNLWCLALGISSSQALSNISCSSGKLYFTSSATLSQGNFWVSFNVSNYLSARKPTVSLNLSSLNNILIGSGGTSFQLIQNQHNILISNTITVFAAQTIFRVTQDVTSINVDSSITRIFSLSLPKDLQLNQITSIFGIQNTTIITSSINLTSNQITLTAAGRLQIQIRYLSNPVKFIGSLQWSITATDVLFNPSSNFSGDHTPQYTSTTSFMNVSLVNPTIQAETSITITLIPALQYYNAPLITISFSDSIVFNCTSCTILAANAASFTYSGAVMRLFLYIKNSNRPNGNSISGVISLSTITFETVQISYSLEPMTYKFVVQQKGLFGNVGSLNITIILKPTQALALTYSSVSPILSDETCVICNSDQLYITGIVGYFQSSSVSLTGTFNGVIYAKATVIVSYVCSVVQGCRLCDPVAPSACQQCFNSSLTSYSLLYQGSCLQNCPLATYSDGRTCISCPYLCDSCSVIQCNLCRTSYYFYNGSCIKPCPSPLVNNATHCITVPIRCPTNCASCPENDVCTVCQGGYYLLENICYSSCPSGYKPEGGKCILSIPPQETSYFPFPFIMSSFLILAGLLAVKCFEKRSLVMGNLIALLSLVEVGSLIMTISYSLKGSNDLLTQALVFMVLFSKVALNLIFLFYFLKAIACEEQFLRWRQAQQAHEGIYRTLVALGSIFSFQLVRVLYSRLLGLRLFFGKFNTSLIFRPINRFSIAHFCTSGAALVALSIRTLLLQEGYHTSAFFSSLQSLIMEGVLLIACIVDSCKGYDSEFFEYQVYKVDNEYQASHIDPIQIENQAQSRGSLHQIINAVGSSKIRKEGGIYRNPLWLKKQFDPLAIPNEGSQLQESQRKLKQGQNAQISNTNLNQNLHSTNEKLKALRLASNEINLEVTSKSIPQDILQQGDIKQNQGYQGVIENKSKGVFRRKIIQQWRQLQKKLPNRMKELRKGWKAKENSIKRSLKRTSSVQQLQIELPNSPIAIPEKIRKHFEGQSQNSKENLKKASSNRKYASFYASKSLSQCQQQQIEEIDQLPIRTGNKYKGIRSSAENILGDFYVEKQQGDLLEDFINDQPGDARTELQDEQEGEQMEGEDAAHFGELGSEQEGDNSAPKPTEGKKSKKMDLGNYRYGGQQQREKKYRTKRRRVNRETEKVYLQRLVGSSDQKLRSKSRNLQF